MKDIKSYLIIENQTLSTNSNHKEIDIITAEKIMAKLLVGLTFELTFKVNKEDLGNTNLSSFEFHPMNKEINHVIAHMIESFLNPDAIVSYTNKKTDKLNMIIDYSEANPDSLVYVPEEPISFKPYKSADESNLDSPVFDEIENIDKSEEEESEDNGESLVLKSDGETKNVQNDIVDDVLFNKEVELYTCQRLCIKNVNLSVTPLILSPNFINCNFLTILSIFLSTFPVPSKYNLYRLLAFHP